MNDIQSERSGTGASGPARRTFLKGVAAVGGSAFLAGRGLAAQAPAGKARTAADYPLPGITSVLGNAAAGATP